MRMAVGTAANRRTWRAPRPPPFLALSIALHLALLAGLYTLGTYRTQQPATQAQQRARVSAALDAARRTQMKRQVRALEEMQRKLAQQAGDNDAATPTLDDLPDDPQALLQRAQQLAEKIKLTEQKTRAAELARLLKITPEAALAKLKAQEPPTPKAAVQPPAATIAQLEQQARSALEKQQQRQQQREQGALIAARSDATRAAPATKLAAGGPAGANAGANAGAQAGAAAGRSGSGSSGSGGSGGGTAGGSGPSGAGSGFSDPRQYGAMVQASALDASTLRAGHGRVWGAGGPLANRIYLDSWYILGPFEGLGSGSLQELYPPESGAVDLDAAYEGLGQRVLTWNLQTNAAYPFVPQPRAENSVYFAYTEIRVDAAREVWLEVGADDDSKLWLNDELVWTSGSGNKPWYRQPFYTLKTDIQQLNLVEGRRRVKLKTGRNRLLFKLYNGIDLMFFAVVVSP
jgi:hypothetical protein